MTEHSLRSASERLKVTGHTLKTAMVGMRHGHMGKVGPDYVGYIGTFRQLEGVEIVAYCEDTDPSLLEPVAQFDPGARTYTSIDDLIRGEEFELAVVVLPAAEIPAIAIKLAEAGKHMYLEKTVRPAFAGVSGIGKGRAPKRGRGHAGIPSPLQSGLPRAQTTDR